MGEENDFHDEFSEADLYPGGVGSGDAGGDRGAGDGERAVVGGGGSVSVGEGVGVAGFGSAGGVTADVFTGSWPAPDGGVADDEPAEAAVEPVEVPVPAGPSEEL